MADDLQHAFAGTCPSCAHAFVDMPNGLADLTVDVIDRCAPPIWGVNTRSLCMTCNRRKGITSTAKLADVQVAYRIRRGEPDAARLFEVDAPEVTSYKPSPVRRARPAADEQLTLPL